MKRVIAAIISTFALAGVLSGCVYQGVDVKLNKNGSGSVAVTIGLKKDFVDNLSSLGQSDPFEGKETFEKEVGGEKYIAYTETTEYSNLDELQKALSEMKYKSDAADEVLGDEDLPAIEGEDEETVTEEEVEDYRVFKSVEIKKDGSKYIFTAVPNVIGGSMSGYDVEELFKADMTLEMPGKITAYKNGKVDGKTITFDLSKMTDEDEMYAECKIPSMVPAFIGIGLAAAAAVAFIVLKKRK
ncbi:MAG: hypothetical protein J5585_07685 [Clostridia bacterium]|nr:hypothetical protein [Clostridia bacterium]